MVAKKKATAKATTIPTAGPVDTIYYRSCDGRPTLYRVEATSVVAAAGGGMDLTEVPPGDVSRWTGESWEPAKLPPVGTTEGCVRHTKNKARTGA